MIFLRPLHPSSLEVRLVAGCLPILAVSCTRRLPNVPQDDISHSPSCMSFCCLYTMLTTTLTLTSTPTHPHHHPYHSTQDRWAEGGGGEFKFAPGWSMRAPSHPSLLPSLCRLPCLPSAWSYIFSSPLPADKGPGAARLRCIWGDWTTRLQDANGRMHESADAGNDLVSP